MNNQKRKILVIEDEKPIAQGLVDLFVFHGFDVTLAENGIAGLKLALTGNFELILLDIMLPGIDGFSVCNQIRAQDKVTPIVMLTAKTSEEDLVNGLSLGADEYITKPFSVRGLVLRVQSILRRTYGDTENERYLEIAGRLTIDCVNLKSMSNDPVEFSRREVDLLSYLLRQGDRPVKRAELLTEVWGYQRASEIETRTVDIHIAKLRRKIEIDPKNPSFLVTMRGEGYKLQTARFLSAYVQR